MSEDELIALDNAEFFQLFLGATRDTYEEYCEFKAAKEGVISYSEPTFEAAMDSFNDRVKQHIKS